MILLQASSLITDSVLDTLYIVDVVTAGSKSPSPVEYGTLFVGIGTFLASVYAWKQQREHNKKTVRPLLQVDTNTTVNPGEVTVVVHNSGFGPAIVIDTKIVIPPVMNGGTIVIPSMSYSLHSEVSIRDVLARIKPEYRDIGFNFHFVDGEFVIPANGTIELFALMEPSEDTVDLVSYLMDADFVVTYKSLYDEKFSTD